MKIGIVNDVSMAVRVLSKVIEDSTNHHIIWHAYDGLEAVNKCAQQTPDLILMDLLMPVMDGVTATQKIMHKNPCAILIVTSSVEKNLSLVYEAMGHGALDVVKTPTVGIEFLTEDRSDLLKKISTIEALLGYKIKKINKNEKKFPHIELRSSTIPLLVIGASTGGPMSIAEILSKFPENSPFATVIIQHMDQEFTKGFAKWLGEHTKIKVEVAQEGKFPKKGCAYIAGQNKHLKLRSNGTFYYVEEPMENPYKPSVDVFFASVAMHWPGKFVATLLTGMGCDGAQGLKQLKDLGWHTIAESKESCVIYGMPKVAVSIGAVSSILHLDLIAEEILSRIPNSYISG